MSTGFSGAFSKRLGERTKELDTFTDDFSPPGATDANAAPNKDNGGYGKTRDDQIPRADPSFTGAERGDAKPDQEALDIIDECEQIITGGIKPIKDQMPGMPDEKVDGPESFDRKVEKKLAHLAASDNAKFDPHQTDPARLSAESFDEILKKFMREVRTTTPHDVRALAPKVEAYLFEKGPKLSSEELLKIKQYLNKEKP